MMSIMLPRREAIKKVAKGIAGVASLVLTGSALFTSPAMAGVQDLNKTHGIKVVLPTGNPVTDSAIVAAAGRVDPRKAGQFPNRRGGK